MVLDAIYTSGERRRGIGCSMTGDQTGDGVIKPLGVSFYHPKRPPCARPEIDISMVLGGASLSKEVQS